MRRRRRRTLGAIATVLLLIVAGVVFWLGRDREAPPPPAPPISEPVVERAPLPSPSASEVEPVSVPHAPSLEPLPALDESDPLVREIAASLSSRPETNSWLAIDELIRRFVASVDNVSEGISPRKHLASLWPRGQFAVTGNDVESLTADPASHARYDAIAEAFIQIDSRAVAQAHRRLRPLIDEAYRDLGYPDRSFDEVMSSAIAELLGAPVVVGEARLTPRVIGYAYVDPELEGLSAAQKQLLRMGPANAPRVQQKLREIARALGIPESELPPTPIHQVASEQ